MRTVDGDRLRTVVVVEPRCEEFWLFVELFCLGQSGNLCDGSSFRYGLAHAQRPFVKGAGRLSAGGVHDGGGLDVYPLGFAGEGTGVGVCSFDAGGSFRFGADRDFMLHIRHPPFAAAYMIGELAPP